MTEDRARFLADLCELAGRMDWRVGITGMMDGVAVTGQELGALEIRERELDDPGRRGWYGHELVATYPLHGRLFDGADVETPVFVAAHGLLEVLRERAGEDELAS